jgi:ferredoxin-thioredoxin reductase catalytic subunit
MEMAEDKAIADAWRDMIARDYSKCYASLFIAHMKEKIDEFAAALAREQEAPTEPDMPAICAALGFDPTNHHNAAKCPYCRPAASEREGAMEDAFEVARAALFLCPDRASVREILTTLRARIDDAQRLGREKEPK